MAITKIKSINQVLEHVTSDIEIVFFDIDNTLLVAADRPNVTQWVEALEKHVRTDYGPRHNLTRTEQDALINEYIDEYIIAMQPQLIEEAALDVISTLQQRKIHVIALTARSEQIAATTTQQLKQCGVNFSNHAFNPKEFNVNHFSFPIIFQDGIISGCHKSKGLAAQYFFKTTQFQPQGVILIDDYRVFLEDAAVEFEKTLTAFKGLHYGYLDDQLKNAVVPHDALPARLR
jgi:predicted HAD superfamily phosphohydrolase YqeG